MTEGAIKYSGDGELYLYEVDGNRVTWCARVGDGEIPVGQIGQKMHQEILDDARHPPMTLAAARRLSSTTAALRITGSGSAPTAGSGYRMMACYSARTGGPMNTTREQREKLRRLFEPIRLGQWPRVRDERAFLAVCRNTLPALLDVIEEADREVERLREGMQVQIERYERLYKHTGKDTHKATACTLRRLLNDGGGYARNKPDK